MDQVPPKYQNQAGMLANRVKKRYRHLKKRFSKENIEVFRLYDWDIPEIRAVVDWYGGHLVVGEYSRRQSTPDWLPMMGKAVARQMGVPDSRLHLKIRRAGIKEGTRYRRLAHKECKITLAERDLKFWINLTDYVDTGLFSDHRDTRMMVRDLSEGRRVLNLYCYTGAFTCYAARGGAIKTVSVDRSETAVHWLKQNLELNRLAGPEHILVQKDVLDFLEKDGPGLDPFDLAVVDPPSYSTTRSAGRHQDLAKDHPDMLNKVFERMVSGGIVFFSTNHQNFTLQTDRLAVTRIKDITKQTIPEDYQSKRKKIHQCWKIIV